MDLRQPDGPDCRPQRQGAQQLCAVEQALWDLLKALGVRRPRPPEEVRVI